MRKYVPALQQRSDLDQDSIQLPYKRFGLGWVSMIRIDGLDEIGNLSDGGLKADTSGRFRQAGFDRGGIHVLVLDWLKDD